MKEIINEYLHDLGEKITRDVYETTRSNQINTNQIYIDNQNPILEENLYNSGNISETNIKQEPFEENGNCNEKYSEIINSPKKELDIKNNDNQHGQINKEHIRKPTQEEIINELKLNHDLEEKINKVIFKQIKEEELDFLKRKISQEITNKRHSVRHKEIVSGISNISTFKKNYDEETINSYRERRNSSINIFGRENENIKNKN